MTATGTGFELILLLVLTFTHVGQSNYHVHAKKNKTHRLCSHSIDYYGWEEEFEFNYKKYHWISTINKYHLQVFNGTWIINKFDIYHSSNNNTNKFNIDLGNSLGYCINLAKTITIDNPGNPETCLKWNKPDIYFQSRNTYRLCSTLNISIEYFYGNLIFIGTCIFIIFIFLCQPCNSYHKKCKKEEYDAVHVETYSKILILKGMI